MGPAVGEITAAMLTIIAGIASTLVNGVQKTTMETAQTTFFLHNSR
jgi:hypothetical protein